MQGTAVAGALQAALEATHLRDSLLDEAQDLARSAQSWRVDSSETRAVSASQGMTSSRQCRMCGGTRDEQRTRPGLTIARQLSILADNPTRTCDCTVAAPVAVPVLDLFAGAGGLSMGLGWAGLTPVAAIEIVPDAASSYAGHHGVEVVRRDIGSLTDQELRAFRDEVRVVAGGPPCQPWSTGGRGRGGPAGGPGLRGALPASL